jgi:hypothetical protein
MSAERELVALRRVRGRLLSRVAIHRYATIGLSAVDLIFEPGDLVQLAAREIAESPFEAFSICTTEAPNMRIAPAHVISINGVVDRAEAFMRDEWSGPALDQYQTIGCAPVEINTGQLGTAPINADRIQSICGVGFTFVGGGTLLISLSDYAGLVDVFTDRSAIHTYRSQFSAVLLSN